MRKAFAVVLVAALVLVAAVYLLIRSPSAEAEKPIRIAFNTWIGYSAIYIAEEKGFFKDRGIAVHAKVIDPLAEKNAAILRGELDAMGGTIDSAVISAASHVDGRIVWMFDRSNGTDGIVVAPGIDSPKDLVGKSVAVEEGFVGHFFLLYVLRKAGVDPTLVRFVPMKTDDAGTAFLAGKVDAAVTWQPYLQRAKERQGAKVLVSSAQLPPILADTLYVSRRFLASDSGRAKVQALIAALQDANDYWISHRDECDRIVARRWKLRLDEIKETMRTVELYTREHQRRQFGPRGGKGELQDYIGDCADLWYQSGVIKEQVDARALVDPTFVQDLFGG